MGLRAICCDVATDGKRHLKGGIIVGTYDGVEDALYHMDTVSH